LLTVPRVRVPFGENLVTIWLEPAAGPVMTHSVRVWMRRFKGESCLYDQVPAVRSTSTTLMPCT
jgi:hypothetical protein